MRFKSRLSLTLSVIGLLLTAAPAWATGDEIEIDPGGGNLTVRNLTNTLEGVDPGRASVLRDDLAVGPYVRLCYVPASGPPLQANLVLVTVISLCDPTRTNVFTLRQNGNKVDVEINSMPISDDAHKCKHDNPDRTCLGNGMPAEMWGPWSNYIVLDGTNRLVVGPPKVRLQLGMTCH